MTDTLTKAEQDELRAHAHKAAKGGSGWLGFRAESMLRALATIDALEAERDEAITDNHTLADAHTSAVLLGGMVMADRADLLRHVPQVRSALQGERR